MEYEIINLAIKQMKCSNMNELIMKEVFFEQYFKVFCNNRKFNEEIINNLKHNLNMSAVINLSDTLITIFKNKIKILREVEIGNKIGLIIFIGDGNIDGHSIILNDQSYVFIDLKAIISRSKKNYDLDVFICHEIIHSIHYNLNKEFYPKNYRTIEDMYLKVLIAEGLATYVSVNLFKIPLELGYWLGFFEKNEVNEWICNCKKMKMDIGMGLKKIIASKEFDNNMYSRLFCIKSEEFTVYRLGYYYGYEIVKNICFKYDIKEALSLKFDDIKKYINDYFKIEIILLLKSKL